MTNRCAAGVKLGLPRTDTISRSRVDHQPGTRKQVPANARITFPSASLYLARAGAGRGSQRSAVALRSYGRWVPGRVPQ